MNPFPGHPPGLGDRAPDIRLQWKEGEFVSLSFFWTQSPILLVFLRHFGCIFCRQQLGELRFSYGEIRRLGTEVVTVSLAGPQRTEAFCQDQGVAFPCLADPEGKAFQAYRLPRGEFWQILGPAVLGRGIQAFLRGARLGRPEGSVRQLPGAFLVNQQGFIQIAHRARHAGDIPPVDFWLQAMQDSR